MLSQKVGTQLPLYAAYNSRKKDLKCKLRKISVLSTEMSLLNDLMNVGMWNNVTCIVFYMTTWRKKICL